MHSNYKSRITQAKINLLNYRHNLELIRNIVGDDTKIMAIIKANAYGHGIERIAQAAEKSKVDFLGLVSIGELEKVRNCGIKTPCLLLNYLDKESIHRAIDLGTSITIMDRPIHNRGAENRK